MNAAIEILGDDDIWVFIGGNLVLDLGGLHPPLEASVSIDSSLVETLNLQAGESYEIAIFHAERQLEGSSLRVTLSGFDFDPSLLSGDCSAE
jgi:fibro-slime domain-containing protein